VAHECSPLDWKSQYQDYSQTHQLILLTIEVVLVYHIHYKSKILPVSV
jgi:hypothetical protein